MVASRAAREGTLGDVMREPGRAPNVVVLEREIDVGGPPKAVDDPERDLWLSTVDGRHQSPIIEIRVGLHSEVFTIHADILRRGEYFRKCLDGNFREGAERVIDLPEEDPSTFSFIIAWLYEGTFTPVKALSSVLAPEVDKGKGREVEPNDLSDSLNSANDSRSTIAGRERRRVQGIRRRQQNHPGHGAINRQRQKQPHRHRRTCRCNRCTRDANCPSCGINLDGHGTRPEVLVQYARLQPPHPPHPPPVQQQRRSSITDAISPEDVRTALLTYNLSVQVYILADRYLLPPLKSLISTYVTDLFETFGFHFSQPSILNSLLILAENLPYTDALLKKIFARVGLLSSRLWREYPEEMGAFFVENPEVGGLLMKETVSRVESQGRGWDWLLPMDGDRVVTGSLVAAGRNPPPPPGWHPARIADDDFGDGGDSSSESSLVDD